MGKARMKRRQDGGDRTSKSRTEAARSRDSQQTRIICVMLVVIVLASYWRAGSLNFTRFDDDIYITHNKWVRNGMTVRGVIWAFTTGHASNWHPLTWLSHQADWELFGENPRGHHLENVLLHAVNTLLLFLLLNRITGFVWRSAFAAALFAVHPLHVESVAWVVERKDVLSTLFWMLTTLAYVEYARKPSRWHYFLVIMLYILGLMTKPMLVSLPLTLMMLDWWPLQRHRQSASNRSSIATFFRASIIEKLPLFILAAISCVITFIVQREGGAMKPLDVIPAGQRIANATTAYVGYIMKMILPNGLAAFYPHPGNTLPVWKVVSSAIVIVLITISAVVGGRRRPYLAVGWLWYIVTLIPVIGIVQVGNQAMADRYTYIPLIGLFLIIAFGIPDIVSSFGGESVYEAGKLRARLLAGSAVAVIVVLMICTYIQVGYWRDTITLFSRALQVTSRNALAHNNLGRALYDEGKPREALKHYRAALRINPAYVDAHYNLGIYYAERREYDRAIAEYEKALKYNPRHALAHNNLGVVLGEQGKLDDAIAHYRQALKISPEYADARYNLALTLMNKGDLKEAASEFKKTLRLMPDHWDSCYYLAQTLSDLGRRAEAISYYRKAALLRPDYALGHYNLGTALHQEGLTDEAAYEYERALELDSNLVPAHSNLGLILTQRGLLDEAIEHYRQALNIDPSFTPAQDNLAQALLMKGRVGKSWPNR